MAYNTNNLNTDSPRMGSGENDANAGYSSAKWVYRDSGGDTLATMAAANFMTDALDKGMQVGDIVDIIETGTAAQKYHVTVVAAAGATLVAFA